MESLRASLLKAIENKDGNAIEEILKNFETNFTIEDLPEEDKLLIEKAKTMAEKIISQERML